MPKDDHGNKLCHCGLPKGHKGQCKTGKPQGSRNADRNQQGEEKKKEEK